MDLEGISALSAAVVAALGVSAAIVVGRWQMRGALRAAEETGRAGIAQAESTYRAALDAVHIGADATHLQWRRGIRRDAYANFLLAMTRCVQAAEALPTGQTSAAQLTVAEEGLAQAKHDLTAALWVVKLEGPPGVALIAGRVSGLTRDLTTALARRAEHFRASEKLHRLGLTNPLAVELERALIEIVAVVEESGYNTHPAAPPQEVAEAVGQARALYERLADEIGVYEWVALLNEALNYLPDPVALQGELSSTVEELLPVCRQALDARPRMDDLSPAESVRADS
ncbi:hypothetical protein PUR59_01590 [Streptomyces sp. SP18ES09]|uniref:hypothetical protein n=1 Tax=Streptomyces sp. SP18ES09 TaxID=3002532 RepID=UPI002E780450|nr:hypothetical protein [Streptomyces sp. SP18ES09]MEE1813734.1 hypothetical protein [Streptomyces sp. SP18ES09]